MISKNFNLDPLDFEIEQRIKELLGVEIYTPDPDRLQKYFKIFKDFFFEKRIPIFIVTGTNGKGETSLFIEDLLLQNGFQPCLWTSPHILTARERFSYNGHPIEPKRLINLIDSEKEITDTLTYYEFLFYLFLKEAKERIIEYENPVLVLEVGLGGRLDATNYFHGDYAGLTNIARDHVEILGPTLKDILREKIEISRTGRPLFMGVEQGALKELSSAWCRERKVERFDLTTTPGWENLSFREKNFSIAKEMVKTFLEDKKLATQRLNMADKLWARPFEVTYGKGQFILVGSHNLDGLRALAKWVNESLPKINSGEPECFDEIWIGLSRKDKDEIEQILKLIQSSRCLGKKIRVFTFDHPRATPLELLKNSWIKFDQGKGRPIDFEGDWKIAIKDFSMEKKVLVTGSNYFVSDILLHSPLKSFT